MNRRKRARPKTPGKRRLTPLAYARRLLAIRPRSVHELRQRMQRHGYSPEEITPVLDHLLASGALDDRAFALLWVEARTARGWGRARLAGELRHRFGLDEGLIEDILAQVYDEMSARKQAEAWMARIWPRLKTHPRGRTKLFERAYRRGIPASWVEQFLREQDSTG